MIKDNNEILSLIISTIGFIVLLFGYYTENIIYLRLLLFTGSFILMIWGIVCFDMISGLSIYLFNGIYASINLWRLIQIYNKRRYEEIRDMTISS